MVLGLTLAHSTVWWMACRKTGALVIAQLLKSVCNSHHAMKPHYMEEFSL